MSAIHEHPIVVGPDDLDDQGHVNNLQYLRWMMKVALAHSAARGWDMDRYRRLGAWWVVRSHYIEYLNAGLADDSIILSTWVADFRKVRSLRRYRFVRTHDDVLLARAETDWALIDIKDRTPRRIPAELREAFEISIGPTTGS